MNTSQINCFLAAAENMNFTKAAERLFLLQTGLSRQIATLEGRFPFDKLISYYDFEDINAAGADALSGAALKSVVVMKD